MGSIRNETYYAGEYLMKALRQTGALSRVLHDGGDIILIELATGEQVSVQMIQSGIPLYEIRKIVADNHASGIYSLFMLWCSMMVPNDGKLYKMDDWMEGFLALNGDRVYAYDIFDGEVYLFDVFFRGDGPVLRAEYGMTLRAGRIHCEERAIHYPGLEGVWRLATFDTIQRRYTTEDILKGALPLTNLEACYALLGVAEGDDRETVKQAYRMLARRYHPDANTDPDAHDQMQKLNEAYDKILDSL